MTEPVREQPAAGVSADVDGLLEPQTIGSWIGPDKDPRTEIVTVYRDSLRRFDPDPTRPGRLIPLHPVTAAEAERRKGGWQYEIDLPPLLEQLQELATSNAGEVEMSSGRRTPSSRAPAGAQFAELLVDIAGTAGHLHREALKQLNRQRETVRRDARGITVAYQPDTATLLRRLADLAADVDSQLAASIAEKIRSWRNAAQILLSINAPMATLEQPCPLCKEQSLIVRSDASNDVVCANRDCKDENGRRTRWPRQRWTLLLASGE